MEHRFVGESALTTRVKEARRAVGDDGTRQAVIRTVHGRGYRFLADVVEHQPVPNGPPAVAARAVGAAAPPDDEGEQQIRFCRSSDGVGLAYAVRGRGPHLVKAANWLTHLDHDWQSPVWRHWLQALGRSHTVVRYDERGLRAVGPGRRRLLARRLGP